MTHKSPQAENRPSHLSYLEIREKNERLTALGKMVKESANMPIALASDLLLLEIGLEEKLKILEATGSRDHLAFEHFLTSHLMVWPQELAALALRIWGAKTNHIFWFRVAEVLEEPALPQRVFYTALDVAQYAGGAGLIQRACQVEGIESMSQALHGLILHRAVQWTVPHPRLHDLAQKILDESRGVMHPDNKAMPSAVAYLARFHPEILTAWVEEKSHKEPWDEQIHAVLSDIEAVEGRLEMLKKLAEGPSSREAALQFSAAWPSLWCRHRLPREVVSAGLQILSPTLDLFSGISEAILTEAVASLDDADTFVRALSAVSGLLRVPASKTVLDALKEAIARAQNPALILEKIPLRLRLDLTSREQGAKAAATILDAIHREESQVLGHETPVVRAIPPEDSLSENGLITQEGVSNLSPHEDHLGRRTFFDLAYRQSNKSSLGSNPRGKEDTKNPGVWDLLADAWISPNEQKLGALAAAARQMPGILRLCYIDTLGRFHGQDSAALKLLDFIRSSEEDDLRAVIRALGGIGTARAAQELVSALTRPNITTALQLETCAALRRLNLEPLQTELRATLNDLSVKPPVDGQSLELREALVALLIPVSATEASTPPNTPILGDRELDQTLSGMVPHYKELSTEVRRALRTSLFFHKQVEAESAPDSIDLSPVIDMQYKALELLFRETFEEPCSRLIQKGVLQRRLDIIGYARPVPHAMDDFESYIASLPIVREIPFFSKFKLRKTLRAICQFKPGKRFTLDGLKAFALFFLCFSRNECKFGLEKLFPLNMASDKELFEFCKSLHIFQDFRNRAAHEGFHPDAAQDMVGIWRQTAEIVQGLAKAKQVTNSHRDDDGRSRKGPVIEKKVS